MSFSTTHTEAGEGARGIKTAVERSLDWLQNAEPGNAPVRWRLTISFRESDAQAVENESARRTGELFTAPGVKRGPGRPRKTPPPPVGPDDADDADDVSAS